MWFARSIAGKSRLVVDKQQVLTGSRPRADESRKHAGKAAQFAVDATAR